MTMTSRALSRLATFVVMAFLACVPGWAMDIKQVVSPGGIKAWLVTSKTVPLIAMSFSFEGGSTLDPKGREGTANYLTGMMDEGADDLDGTTFQAKRDDIAMKLRFSVGLDRIEGSFQTPAKDRAEAFGLLRKALSKPHFETEAMERMRQQFTVNAQQNADDPNDLASKAAMQLAFGDHPYSRASAGTVESIKAISADDLRAYHKAVFTQAGLKVAVVGDIDEAELGKVLDEVFGSLPKGELPPAPDETEVASGPLVKVIDRDIPQSIIIFGAQGIKRDDPAFFPAFVMAHILGGGDFGTRLTSEVREKRGLTYGISYGLSPLARAGGYLGGFSTRNEKAGEALQVVKETIRKMADEGPSQQELDNAKTFLTGSYALRFDSNEKIADQLLGQLQTGQPIDYFNTRNGKIEAVTLDQVKEQAKRLLDPEKLIVVVVGKPEGVKSTVQ